MKFTLTIDCNNAAFADYTAEETATILEGVVASLRGMAGTLHTLPLRDSNGNRVGEAAFTDDEVSPLLMDANEVTRLRRLAARLDDGTTLTLDGRRALASQIRNCIGA